MHSIPGEHAAYGEPENHKGERPEDTHDEAVIKPAPDEDADEHRCHDRPAEGPDHGEILSH